MGGKPGFFERLQLREFIPFVGPAFVASVAYVDPGNFATNIAAGSDFRYQLLWVLLWSNLMAILVQLLSAKLGIATGRSLPRNCREHFPRATNYFLWVAGEISALATDLAEFLGAALGFSLLFGMPLLPAALLTGVATFLILSMERLGFRKLEYVIMAFVGVISLAYVAELFLAKPPWGQIVHHVAVPHLDASSLYVAVGMLGATVMPHVVYLHSALVLPRRAEMGHKDHARHFRMERIEVLVAMNVAWVINSAMVIMSAAVFHDRGMPVQSIEEAHRTLAPLLGEFSSFLFAVALLASGLSSSAVGTLAGQVILEGFLDVKMSIFLRRLITMVPALVVIALGLDPLKILVLSQVCLSFSLPFAIGPLVWLTSRKSVMGEQVNRPWTTGLAVLVTVVIVSLNGLLVYQVLGGKF
ncbi:MAG TPA: Nramp family divalent metal transporter [Candidatus Eisenbacteria bacterium]|nr:Nramp family divalent metal transporter [Candidatus Eisenbacteria bacterium]